MSTNLTILRAVALAATLTLAACGSDDNSAAGADGGTSATGGTTGATGGTTGATGGPGTGTGTGGGAGTGVPSARLCGDLVDGVDVALVLDSSGSMGSPADGIGPPTRMEVARDGAEGLAQRLGSGDRSALVDYDTGAVLVQPLTFNHADTIAKVRLLVDDGNTNPGDALRIARDELLINGRPGAHKILIHETDGIPNTGPDPLAEAEAARQAGIEFFAIGIGDGIDDAELRKQVSAPEDQHYFTSRNAQEVLNAFNRVSSTLGARRLTVVASAYALRGFGSLERPAANHQIYVFDESTPANNRPGGTASAVPLESAPAPVQVTGGVGDAVASGEVPADLASASAEARSTLGAISVWANGVEVLGIDAGRVHALSSAARNQNVAEFSESELDSGALAIRVMGQPVALPLPPNSEFELPGLGRVVLNEQQSLRSSVYAGRSISLAHLHTQGAQPGELIIGHAFAGVSCVSPTPFPPE